MTGRRRDGVREVGSGAQRLIPLDWRKNNIGFVRLLLALAVIFSHAFPILESNYRFEPVYSLYSGYVSLGRVAVVGFFAISGMLISESWIRRPVLKEFLLRRFLRIWPGFVAASLAMLLLVVPLGTHRPSEYLASLRSANIIAGHLVRAVMLKQPQSAFGFETNPYPRVIDGSLWSITYEFVWYAIVAVLGVSGFVGKRKPTLTLAMCTLLLGVADGLCGGKLGAIQIIGIRFDNLVSCGAPFTAGMFAAVYKDRIPRHPLLLAAALASLLLAHYSPKLMLVLLPTSFVYALFWFCFSSSPRLAPIGSRNDLSYGFYLYAFGLEQLLVSRLHWLKSPVLLFVIATVVTAPFALFSWFCVERPAKDLFKGRAPNEPRGLCATALDASTKWPS